jgi:hypothetical protein
MIRRRVGISWAPIRILLECSIYQLKQDGWLIYFFEKKDLILPCPVFLPLAAGMLMAGFFLGGGTGSSSENDSHMGS